MADSDQQNIRFTGGEARVDVAIRPSLWLKLGADAVNARLISSRLGLPAHSPVRGRIGLHFRRNNFTVRPELVLSNHQYEIFSTEEPTAGYALGNLAGSYTLARAHQLHVFPAELFNAGDRLYRNHLPFIKGFAPEMGRGVRIGYTIQFF